MIARYGTMRLLLVSWCVFLAASGCSGKATDYYQGYAEGEFVLAAAPAAGRLEKRWVQRGQEVKAGDPLFTLEQENEKANRREAEARLRTAEAGLANLMVGRRPSEVDAAKAELSQAEEALKLSALQHQRMERLFASGYVARADLDEARTNHARDRERVAAAQAQLQTARQAIGRDREIAAARAEAEAARASLEQSDWRLQQRAVRATEKALVQDTLYSEGEWVQAGGPVVSLLPPANVKLRFFVPEAVVGSVKTGQPVEVRCDGCGDPIPAKVSFVSPQAEYTPPVIYSRDQRTRLVFLIEARPAPADAMRLHPGQPVDVRLK